MDSPSVGGAHSAVFSVNPNAKSSVSQSLGTPHKQCVYGILVVDGACDTVGMFDHTRLACLSCRRDKLPGPGYGQTSRKRHDCYYNSNDTGESEVCHFENVRCQS